MNARGAVILCFLPVSLIIFAGCPPPEQKDTIITEQYKAGYNTARNFMSGRLAEYQLVITLHGILFDDRSEFLEGFKMAYVEGEKSEQGQKYAEILSEAVKAGTFEEAKERGIQHAKKLTTDAQIQNLIRGSLGISRSKALAWKAGYIEGFKIGWQQVSSGQDTQCLYKRAEAMYEALRAASGL